MTLSSSLPIPAPANLEGMSIFRQWAVLEPGVGPFLKEFALSHGLQNQLGQ